MRVKKPCRAEPQLLRRAASTYFADSIDAFSKVHRSFAAKTPLRMTSPLCDREVKIPTLSHKTRQGWGTRLLNLDYIRGGVGFDFCHAVKHLAREFVDRLRVRRIFAFEHHGLASVA